MDRRNFLQILGFLSSATALTACGSETGQKKLISVLVPPEDGSVPGAARWLPTTCTECPAGCGMLVRLREGWPVKAEGIPEHPISHGALCMRGQAILWRLYHPERLKTPLERTPDGSFREIAWDEAVRRIDAALESTAGEGRSSVYLSGRTTGTLGEAIDLFCSRRKVVRLPEFEPFSHAALRQAYGAAFGLADVPHYRIEEADALLTVGADILETFVSPVDFAFQVRSARENSGLAWTHVEPHASLTGMNADRRLTLLPGSEPALLQWLLQSLPGDRLPAGVKPLSPEEASRRTGLSPQDLGELSALLTNAVRPLLIVGALATAHPGGGPAAALAALIQGTLQMPGRTIDFSRRENYGQVGSVLDLERLAAQLDEGKIGVMFVTRADPLRYAPASLGFGTRLQHAALRVGFADLFDPTMRACDLVLPLSHPLEAWGDVEARRGIRGIIQPAIAPLYPTRSEGEILLSLIGGELPRYPEFLFAAWRRRFGEEALARFAESGFIAEKPVPAKVTFAPANARSPLAGSAGSPLAEPVVTLAPSIRHFDGRSRSLPLLSEVPDPLTTVSWGEWVSVPAAWGPARGVKDRQQFRFAAGDWTALLPVKLQPGLPEGVMTLQLSLLDGAPPAFDPQTGELILYLEGVMTEKRGRRADLPILAGSSSQKGRGMIPEPIHREGHKRVSLYPEHEHPEHRWAMAIDLARCIGCGACAAACYAENNVPVVGRDEHRRGREMSWLRIEPFYDGTSRPEFLPMLCQHCHYAPCEPVCPVYAAYHNGEGLNVQVYNRCVGTRYCSNNCPYKVRRFNWFDYRWPAPTDKMLNPDLSVRTRGIMEKCTFCIQRIRAARDRAKDEGRPIRDGEFTTACAQTCPTGAITFGNLLDPDARVTQLTRSERAYWALAELGTEPSIYYLGSRQEARGNRKRHE